MTPQQKRRALKLRERKKLIEKMKQDFVACVMCGGPADDLDEIVSRGRGGQFTPENCQPLCRRDHDWKTTHPREAQEQGWSKHGPVFKGEME